MAACLVAKPEEPTLIYVHCQTGIIMLLVDLQMVSSESTKNKGQNITTGHIFFSQMFTSQLFYRHISYQVSVEKDAHCLELWSF